MSNRVHAPFPFGNVLPDKLDFISIQFDDSGYRVRVSEFSKINGPVYEINFGKMPLAQRSMDEGKFLAMTAISHEKVGPVVLVTGSDFLDWFHEQSCGVFTKDEVKHVAILTQDEWIEVLCLNLPTIKVITSQSSSSS